MTTDPVVSLPLFGQSYNPYSYVLNNPLRYVDPSCPNCGASLDINMTGHCAYCKAKVTSGEFDWVLSRIEQDEVYR